MANRGLDLLDPARPEWAPRWVPDVHDDVARRRFTWLVVAVLAAGLLAFVTRGGDRPPDPTFRPGSGVASIDGFSELAFRIRPSALRTDADELYDALRCALLADTPEERSQGLMGLTDLGGYEGMIFKFAEDSTAGFHMEGTPLPLSIAWFDAAGQFISAADMDPCAEGGDCPGYHAPRPYRYALEVPRGRFHDLGVGPGSWLVLAGPCPPR